jgi:hypothetical protein
MFLFKYFGEYRSCTLWISPITQPSARITSSPCSRQVKAPTRAKLARCMDPDTLFFWPSKLKRKVPCPSTFIANYHLIPDRTHNQTLETEAHALHRNPCPQKCIFYCSASDRVDIYSL